MNRCRTHLEVYLFFLNYGGRYYGGYVPRPPAKDRPRKTVRERPIGENREVET